MAVDNRMIPKTMPLTEVFENYKRYYKKFYAKYATYNDISQKDMANDTLEVNRAARKYKHMIDFFKFIAYNEYDILILGIEDDEVIFRCTHAEEEINHIDRDIENSMDKYDRELRKELGIDNY